MRELGCESAQGHLFGRPMPGERMLEIANGLPHNGLANWPWRHVESEVEHAEKAGYTAPIVKGA